MRRAAERPRVLAYSYPDEYHFYPPNTEALRSLSNETKGRFQPRAEDIFDAKWRNHLVADAAVAHPRCHWRSFCT